MLMGMISLLAMGQMVPDAPIRNFRLPMFDSVSGYKKWELTGDEGKYISREEVQIRNFVLRFFSEGVPPVETIRVQSPSATLHPLESSALGADQLFIRSTEYQISGKNWQWDGKKNRFVIRENARVFFKQDIDNWIQ
jgi:hypothetical protein